RVTMDLFADPARRDERLTTEAMLRQEPLIYSGRIVAADLVGEPDLLQFTGAGYIAGDIKSGAGDEGQDVFKPKLHYAVQVALYTDILERLGQSGSRHPLIIDIHGGRVIYALDATYGRRRLTTLWIKYQETLAEARAVLSQRVRTRPAHSSRCKLCCWHT